MRLVRQGFTPLGASDDTDGPGENGESEAMSDDAMGDSTAALSISHGGHSVSDVVEFLKSELNMSSIWYTCGEIWDANVVQNTILSFVDDIRTPAASEMLGRCCEKVVALFGERNQKEIEQN